MLNKNLGKRKLFEILQHAVPSVEIRISKCKYLKHRDYENLKIRFDDIEYEVFSHGYGREIYVRLHSIDDDMVHKNYVNIKKYSLWNLSESLIACGWEPCPVIGGEQ